MPTILMPPVPTEARSFAVCVYTGRQLVQLYADCAAQ